MASSTRSFSFITLVLSTLLLSTQIHARESYFFGKVQRANAQDKNLNFNPVETSQKTSVEVLPEKEGEKQDQDPGFVPESESGYGLYGHETTYNNDESSNNNKNNYKYNNDNEEFSKHNEESVSYEPYNTPSLSQTEESYNYDKYSKNSETYENGYNNDEKNNNNNNEKNYYNSNAYGRERSSGYKGYKNDMEKQGMSDTRFMENGKYYFDVNDENNHGDLYKKHYRHRPSSSYAVSNYDKVGQDNNGRSFYDDNNNSEQSSFQDPYNSKWEKNMMNEQEQEEEFGGEQQDQFVP